jgi:ribonuclease E
MEMSRQRVRAEKMQATYASCPMCEGYGLVKNVESAGLAALRKLQARCLKADFGRIRMGVPPEIAQWILNFKREEIVALERRNGIKILVEPKGSLLRHESEFEFYPREKVEVPPALVLPDRQAPPAPPDMKDLEEAPTQAEGPSPDGPLESAPAVPSEEGAPGRKRRRRRRRRGRGAGAEEGAPPDVPAEPPQEAAEAEPAATEADDGVEGDPGAPPGVDEETPGLEPSRKRRRRRRRRGRRGAADGVSQDPEAPAPPPGPEVEEIAADLEPVPTGIRSDELMPAATGGPRRRRFRR